MQISKEQPTLPQIISIVNQTRESLNSLANESQNTFQANWIQMLTHLMSNFDFEYYVDDESGDTYSCSVKPDAISLTYLAAIICDETVLEVKKNTYEFPKEKTLTLSIDFIIRFLDYIEYEYLDLIDSIRVPDEVKRLVDNIQAYINWPGNDALSFTQKALLIISETDNLINLLETKYNLSKQFNPYTLSISDEEFVRGLQAEPLQKFLDYVEFSLFRKKEKKKAQHA